MRLLFWTELYWPYIGGVEVFSSKLIAALRGRRISPTPIIEGPVS